MLEENVAGSTDVASPTKARVGIECESEAPSRWSDILGKRSSVSGLALGDKDCEISRSLGIKYISLLEEGYVV